MRTLWTVVSTMAVANLLALGAFAVWLRVSDRLDTERLERVRQVFAETRAEQEAREAADQAEAARQDALIEAERDRLRPPLTAEERLGLSGEVGAVNEQTVERLRREVEDLKRTLQRERAELDGQWAELRAEREGFEAMRRRIAEIEGGDQFKKATNLYQSLKPVQTRDAFQALIDQGEIEQVVSYLNAMQERPAAKVLAEFEDPAVAADLLERLRTRGITARAPEDDP